MKNKLLIILIISISFFSLISCTNKNNDINKNIETEKDIYIKNVKKLKKVKESTKDIPFNVEIKFEKMDDEVRYQVIIDNPISEIKNINALAVHNKQTEDIFPSVGIFDKKVNLIPDEKPSGVILVGYFPYKGEIENLKIQMKVLINYKIDGKTYTSYYVTKK